MRAKLDSASPTIDAVHALVVLFEDKVVVVLVHLNDLSLGPLEAQSFPGCA